MKPPLNKLIKDTETPIINDDVIIGKRYHIISVSLYGESYVAEYSGVKAYGKTSREALERLRDKL